MRILTEQRAWLHIASQLLRTPDERSPFPGLCSQICILHRNSRISDDTRHAMLKRVRQHKYQPNTLWGTAGYHWPLTPNGDRRRRNFALEQAKQL